jgi:hypothetical protein
VLELDGSPAVTRESASRAPWPREWNSRCRRSVRADQAENRGPVGALAATQVPSATFTDAIIADVHRIDHACIGARNIYDGFERLRDETGFDSYDGGWNPGMGVGQRIVPLGSKTYIEINSVVDRDMALTHFHGRWYEAVLSDAEREDRFMGWVIATDSIDELNAIGERLGLEIAHEGKWVDGKETAWKRRRPNGKSHRNENVPDDRHHGWPRGLPMFMHWPAENQGDHPDLIPEALGVAHRGPTPRGIAWVEVGDEKLTRQWLGPVIDDLDVRFVDGPAGLYALAVSTDAGEVVIRRKPAPLKFAASYNP